MEKPQKSRVTMGLVERGECRDAVHDATAEEPKFIDNKIIAVPLSTTHPRVQRRVFDIA
jgi:hypothetical protein